MNDCDWGKKDIQKSLRRIGIEAAADVTNVYTLKKMHQKHNRRFNATETLYVAHFKEDEEIV